MAWSEAARRAAAEARRLRASTKGARVGYSDRQIGSKTGAKSFGVHAFQLRAKGAAHTVMSKSMTYKDAKGRAMKLASRISARIKRPVNVTRLP